ncbi:MAG: IS110 family transposase [Sphingobacteriales bacterium]|nr:MAG: IS110 family transposase [Sphingobacteriales bacterium]
MKKKGTENLGAKRIVPQKEVIGIDVSSKSHSVRIGYKLPIEETVHIGEEKTFANDDQGHEALLAYVTKFTHPDCTNRVFVMEATGIYHEDLAYYLDKSGAFVTVVLPSRAMAYKKSENVLSKTDGIDARLLVKMGLEKTLARWEPPSAEVYELKQLCREHGRLIADKTVVKNRTHAMLRSSMPSKSTLGRNQESVNLLQKQIEAVEKEMALLVSKHKPLLEAVKRAVSIPGIGRITATIVLAETNLFKNFNNAKQVTKYTGLDIVQRESGTFKGKQRISKHGNSFLRAALYMPALSAVRYNMPIKDLFDRITDKSGIKMKGITAASRKLLCLMCSMEKNKKILIVITIKNG